MLKIGVFDSGLGGLTVVKALSEVLKGADIFYIADTKHAPYGEKTPEEILQYSLNITKYLIDTYQIDALILACNTATAFAIKELRTLYPKMIILGTEPGIKPAIAQTKTGKIGVLATPATLKGEKYQGLVKELSLKQEVVLFEQDCPGLVEQIEKGEINSPKTKALLQTWLLPMQNNHVDTIVLGCTHYPLVAETIKDIMQYDIKLIETGSAIARHLLHSIDKIGHKNDGALSITIHSTDTIDTNSIDNIITDYTLSTTSKKYNK